MLPFSVNARYYLPLFCKALPPLFPTQIARIARLSQIGCNIRTLAAIFAQRPAHFNFCSKIRKIQRYVVFLRKVGLYSGAGLVFVENRAEGILWVQQQARVKLIKSCSPPSRLWSSLLACLPPGQMVNAILTMSIQVYVQLKFY